MRHDRSRAMTDGALTIWLGAALAVLGGVSIALAVQSRRLARTRERLAEIEHELAQARDQQRAERVTAEAERCSLEERARALESRKREVDGAIDDVQRAQRQVVQSEKLASLGRMAAGVAHEFNNPAQHLIVNLPYLRRGIDRLRSVLNVALENAPQDPAAAEKLKRAVDGAKLGRTNSDLDEILEGLNDGATKIGELVRDLTTFSRVDTADVKEVDVHEGLDAAIRLLGYRFKDRVEVHREYAPVPRIRCHPGQINHVFMNLFSNAADAISGRGNLWVKTEPAPNGFLRIRVTDDGSGMDPTTLARAFDPFFTTKEPGVGTGLGLATSYDIVKRHGGDISAQSDPGIGTVFTVELPVNPPFLETTVETRRSG